MPEKLKPWKELGLIDYKFADVNIVSFEDTKKKMLWRLKAAYTRSMIVQLVILDGYTIASLILAKENNGAALMAFFSIIDWIVTTRNIKAGRARFDKGDISDTYADSWSYGEACASSLGIYCLFSEIDERIIKDHPGTRRLFSLREHLRTWKQLLFVQFPQLIVLVMVVFQGKFAHSYSGLLKLLFLSIQLCRLSIEVIAYPFVRCGILAATNSTLNMFQFCSLQADRIMNAIINERLKAFGLGPLAAAQTQQQAPAPGQNTVFMNLAPQQQMSLGAFPPTSPYAGQIHPPQGVLPSQFYPGQAPPNGQFYLVQGLAPTGQLYPGQGLPPTGQFYPGQGLPPTGQFYPDQGGQFYPSQSPPPTGQFYPEQGPPLQQGQTYYPPQSPQTVYAPQGPQFGQAYPQQGSYQ